MKKNKNLVKSKNMYLFIVILIFISCDKEHKEIPLPYPEGTVRIAKWQGNKKAALILQFDDSTEGQATLGVPALNARNLIGTWYVNPGNENFNKYINYWENIAPEGGQELANHTMTHTGASTFEETEYEVGEASKKIWSIRKHAEYGSLIAFNKGGGTSWNEEDLETIMEKYKNIDRQIYLGMPAPGISIHPGTLSEKMYEIVPDVVADSAVGAINFHGIAAENGNPPKDGGHGAVWIKEFEAFLDKLVDIKGDIWSCGYIQVYKYIKELQTASVSIAEYSDGRLAIELKSEMDVNYYNEPLTVLVYLSQEWKSCLVNHNGSETIYPIQNGVLMFNAIPNKGEILLTQK